MHVFSLWSAAWCDADDGALRCYQSIPHKLSWRGSSEGRHCLFVFTLGACCVPDGARDTQRERASGERGRDRAHNATRVASAHNAHNAHSVSIRHHHQRSDVKGPSQLFNMLVNRKLVCSLGLVVRVTKDTITVGRMREWKEWDQATEEVSSLLNRHFPSWFCLDSAHTGGDIQHMIANYSRPTWPSPPICALAI